MLKIGKLGFDPANPPDGVWAVYVEGVRAQIRKFTVEVYDALRKPFVKTSMELEPGTRKMVAVEKVEDIEGALDATIDYILQDFEGFCDEEGKLLPVTLESKKRIVNYPEVKNWIYNFAHSLEVVEAEQKAEEIKNSEASPGVSSEAGPTT